MMQVTIPISTCSLPISFPHLNGFPRTSNQSSYTPITRRGIASFPRMGRHQLADSESLYVNVKTTSSIPRTGGVTGDNEKRELRIKVPNDEMEEISFVGRVRHDDLVEEEVSQDRRESRSIGRTPAQSQHRPLLIHSKTSPSSTGSSPIERGREGRGRNRKIVPLSSCGKVFANLPSTPPIPTTTTTTTTPPPTKKQTIITDESIHNKSTVLLPSAEISPLINQITGLPESPPPVPGQIIIGPPVLGLGLAFKNKKEEGNHDVRLSRMLEMGVDMEGRVGGGVGGVGVGSIGVERRNLGLEMRQEDANGVGPRMTLSQGTLRDRAERTPHRGRSPAQTTTIIKHPPHLTRTDALRRLGRIASPRGSHIDVTYLSRSADSRISNVSVSGITDKTILEPDGDVTPRCEGFTFSHHQGAALHQRNTTDLVSDALTQSLNTLRKRENVHSGLGRIVGDGARDKVTRTEWRGTLRIKTPAKAQKETIKSPKCRPSKGKGRSTSLSAVGLDPSFNSKTIASIARQRTNAIVSAADVFNNGLNESYISEPDLRPSPQLDAVITRPRSASVALKLIQEDDLAKLRSIWAAPLEEQHSRGSRLSSNESIDTRKYAEQPKRSVLELGFAKLGLGWASKTTSLADKPPAAAARVPSTPDLAGFKSPTLSGVSSGLATPNLDPAEDWSYTRWDGQRMPITPDHRVHWDFLNKRRASYGVKTNASDTGRRVGELDERNGLFPSRTLIDSPAGGPARFVEITDFDLSDNYFAIPVSGHRRSSTPLNSRSSSYGSRELRPSIAPLHLSSSKAIRPKYKTSHTSLGLGTSKRRPSYPSSRSSPPLPQPPVCYGSQMAISIGQSKVHGASGNSPTHRPPPRSVSGAALHTPSSLSGSVSLSTSFDSRMAYEACKGEEGYVSFDRVMGRGEDD